MSRFDYVAYDDKAKKDQKMAKDLCSSLETNINLIGRSLDPLVDKAFCARAKEHAVKALEEVYMWIGKAIRDEQIARGLTTKQPLQEERNNA